MKKWGRKRIRSALAILLLISITSVGTLVSQTQADEYEVTFGDTQWDQAFTEGESSLTGAQPEHTASTSDGVLDMYVNANSGWSRVKGYVKKSFQYTGETQKNWIRLDYHLDGWMRCLGTIVGTSYCSLTVVKAELWEAGQKLHTYKDMAKELDCSRWTVFPKTWEKTQDRYITFLHELESSKTYTVYLKAEVYAEAWSASSTSDFLEDQRRVDLNSLKVSHTHVETITEHNPNSGVPVTEEFGLVQNKLEDADSLTFTSYNTDIDINGWRITVKKFTNSHSDRGVGQREVDVQTWGTSIPKGDGVHIKVTQWVNAENEMGLKDVRWHKMKSRKATPAEVMPDHYWSVSYPVCVRRHRLLTDEPAAAPTPPGENQQGLTTTSKDNQHTFGHPVALRASGESYWIHWFTMTNDDTTDSLDISALQFLATNTHFGHLGEIQFLGPLYNFELAPGQGLKMAIKTASSLIGGYIYFKYSINDPGTGNVVCNVWGGHPVTSAPAGLARSDVTEFAATIYHTYVQLEWGTEAKTPDAGFNLYRSAAQDGPYVRINQALIPAQGHELCAATYSFKDYEIAGGATYYYLLEEVTPDKRTTLHGPVSAKISSEESEELSVPSAFDLSQNYPNPFNTSTEITYTSPTDSHVRLAIYNIAGQKVRILVDQDQSAGHRAVLWDGKNDSGEEVASGVYFYRISIGDFSQTKKMLLLK